MPNQQSLYALCGEGVRELSRSPEEWLGFLRTACRNYRCPFPEQLLIYKQRPEATAVLELERWNALFGRWVNRGAQGIAVLDHSGDSVKIKYYFDIADTHPGAGARRHGKPRLGGLSGTQPKILRAGAEGRARDLGNRHRPGGRALGASRHPCPSRPICFGL